jgi:hypothetical protein
MANSDLEHPKVSSHTERRVDSCIKYERHLLQSTTHLFASDLTGPSPCDFGESKPSAHTGSFSRMRFMGSLIVKRDVVDALDAIRVCIRSARARSAPLDRGDRLIIGPIKDSDRLRVGACWDPNRSDCLL